MTNGSYYSSRTLIQGTTGIKSYSWTTKRTVELGNQTVAHSFLVMPDCPYPLLGQDLLSKMKANIHFSESKISVGWPGKPVVCVLTLEDEFCLYEGPKTPPPRELIDWLQQLVPAVWAKTNSPGLASHLPPVIVELKPLAQLIRV